VGPSPSLVLTPNRECEMAVKFVGADVVLVAPNGWFSTSAVEVDGSGRTGLGLPFSCQFDPRTLGRTGKSIQVCSEFMSDTNRLDSQLDGRPVS
jgi:hypothetical protein